MKTLAVWSPAEVDTSTQGANLARTAMTNLSASIREGSQDDRIHEAAQWAAQVRAVARLRSESHDLNVQCCRLEAIIARRSGQLDELEALDKASYRQAAKAIARLTETEFDGYLAWIDRDGSVASLWTAYGTHLRQRQRIADLAAGRVPDVDPTGRIRPQDSAWSKYGHRQHEIAGDSQRMIDGAREVIHSWDAIEVDARDAAHDLLDALTRHGEPFTTLEAADKLADVLDVDGEDEVVRQGLNSLVRQAIIVENRAGDSIDAGSGEVSVPAFVTFYTVDGWQRVPWGMAGLDQFGRMVAHRRQQAEDMAHAADALASLYELLAGESGGDSDDRCADLLNRWHDGSADQSHARAS